MLSDRIGAKACILDATAAWPKRCEGRLCVTAFNSYNEAARLYPVLLSPWHSACIDRGTEGNIMKIKTNVKAGGKPFLNYKFGLVFTPSS